MHSYIFYLLSIDYTMQKIQTGDMVLVTTGQFKWKTAKILKIGDQWVYLEWLNIKKRAKKWQWYINVHHAINASNVQYRDWSVSSKVAIEVHDGKKVRVAKKTKALIKK